MKKSSPMVGNSDRFSFRLKNCSLFVCLYAGFVEQGSKLVHFMLY